MKADIAIIGAGMAGASLAAEVGGRASVLLLEAEARPGYHSTGRSAAFWSETYGGPKVQPLTSASGRFLAAPPPSFSERPFLSPRRALHLADAKGRPALDALCAEFSGGAVALERLDRARLETMIPGLRAGWDEGVLEGSCTDIDVGGLHAAYLKAARAQGVRLVTDARVARAERRGTGWRLDSSAGSLEADVIVNAAGAWADEVATLVGAAPLGIQPYRRTIVQLRTTPPAPAEMPLVIDALGRFYFKPEAGRLWLSPHDETPCVAADCGPEEIDVALAIDRFERVVDWKVERVEHSWAGLRSFAPDRLPVYGFDSDVPGFFWFAGQGGFGIQTAPAAAKLAAGLLLEVPADPLVADIDPSPYLAGRFRN
ncbi:NAD(P)/FAD-dependent oxidoreductase [Sphingosinicella humi]|uniref:FAD-dependent oxidoreductase n=1 Tax=Allosphingosinicella humi TaxID=2068657 RepID=A0A2U2J4L4_9SPHN|nr:FAD-dependent oxidoreductase [Sphingosinicella humi]PWG03286.1 FAD-dependent oxidoreductase [Sphingosinicella humi]